MVNIFFFLVAFLFISQGNSAEDIAISARVESCRGCSLNRLPEVKQFIFEDVPQYEDVEFKHIQGAQPELVLLDANSEEVERLPLSKLSRAECNQLLESKGFYKSDAEIIQKTEF